MSADELLDGLRVWFFILFVVAIVVGGIIFLYREKVKGVREDCIAIGERLGYETELIQGYCYIEVRPGLKVRSDQILDFLPVIDCR